MDQKDIKKAASFYETLKNLRAGFGNDIQITLYVGRDYMRIVSCAGITPLPLIPYDLMLERMHKENKKGGTDTKKIDYLG